MEVEDEGPGIPAADRARVFERFYRIPRRGGPEGSGLGLAIVRALADRLGADVRLYDRKTLPTTTRARTARNQVLLASGGRRPLDSEPR